MIIVQKQNVEIAEHLVAVAQHALESKKRSDTVRAAACLAIEEALYHSLRCLYGYDTGVPCPGDVVSAWYNMPLSHRDLLPVELEAQLDDAIQVLESMHVNGFYGDFSMSPEEALSFLLHTCQALISFLTPEK